MEKLLPRAIGSTIRQIAAGEWHGMALTESGMVWAWGSNRSHQCGRKQKPNPSGTDEMPTLVVPAPVPLDIEMGQIAAGRSHSLALTKVSQQVYSWGSSLYGQCGHAIRRSPQPPRLVEGMRDLNVAKIAAGGNHSLALSVGGRLFSWGQHTEGQLGLGPACLAQPKPRLVSELDFVAIVAGQEWRAQKNAAASSSPTPSGGVLTSVSSSFESPLKIIPRIVDIYAGPSYSIAVSSSGHAYGFGSNDTGQLGLPTPAKLPLRDNSSPASSLTQSSQGESAKSHIRSQDVHVQTFDSHHNVLLPTRVDQLVETLRIRTVACGPNHVWFFGDEPNENDHGTTAATVGKTLHEVHLEAALQTRQRLESVGQRMPTVNGQTNTDVEPNLMTSELNDVDFDATAQSTQNVISSAQPQSGCSIESRTSAQMQQEISAIPESLNGVNPLSGDWSDLGTSESKKEEDDSENTASPQGVRQTSSSVPVSPLGRESPRGPRAVISRLSLKLRRRLGGSNHSKTNNEPVPPLSGPSEATSKDQQSKPAAAASETTSNKTAAASEAASNDPQFKRFARRTKQNTM